ncbi:MAG: nucleotidyltransferase substrate binding protein [Gammaproteobacteria bacterium]|nr:nucleotidyltransferase substrate binding protein [Gammaproteobacteria bacterium]
MLNLSALAKANTSLQESLDVFQDNNFISKLNDKQFHTIRAGVIQNFEFTYEVSWKFIKRWLDNNLGATEVDGVSRRQLFRIAAEHQLIEDVEAWMTYHKYRNLTSHTYDENTAKEVANIAIDFAVASAALLIAIETRNE